MVFIDSVIVKVGSDFDRGCAPKEFTEEVKGRVKFVAGLSGVNSGESNSDRELNSLTMIIVL